MSEKTYSSLIESLDSESPESQKCVIHRLQDFINKFSPEKNIENNKNNIRLLINPENTLSNIIDTSMKFTIGHRRLLTQELPQDSYDENNYIVGLDNDNGLHSKEIEIRFNHKINKWIVVLLESSLNYIKIFKNNGKVIRLKLDPGECKVSIIEENDVIHIGKIEEFNNKGQRCHQKGERYHQIQILNGYHYDNSENECSENDSIK
jgi:hypothetical protein